MLKKLHHRSSLSVPNSREGSRNSSPLQGRHSLSSLITGKGSPYASPLPSRLRLFGRSHSPLSHSLSSSREIDNLPHSEAISCTNSPFLARAARYSDTKPPISPLDNIIRKGDTSPSPLNSPKLDRQRSKSCTAGKIRTSKVSFSGSSCAADNNGPEADEFQDSELRNLIYDVLDTHLRNVTYEHNLSGERCRLLTKILESSTKSRLPADHEYKVVAVVFMGEVLDDGIKVASQCSWNPNVDRFAMTTYQTESLFVSAMVLASEIDDTTSDEYDSYDGDSA